MPARILPDTTYCPMVTSKSVARQCLKKTVIELTKAKERCHFCQSPAEILPAFWNDKNWIAALSYLSFLRPEKRHEFLKEKVSNLDIYVHKIQPLFLPTCPSPRERERGRGREGGRERGEKKRGTE